ncbi:hypothetical protein BDZ94DRAFT_1252248 [Collybia nuda]|uniref:RING-type domain-containing protein n=1 Tax=Collybia nuda TaxID=64659 RepID=A0A9P5YBD2_9AGAR|nr:hypothetical protein BDZ94DRAFT_1252248 [Collybia nuda]
MSGKCSICLSAFREPVSIPCGHVYCTKCLADHVNTSGNEEATSSTCPTCRTSFKTVTPDLTYLPKKYHQYIVPGVRRVYLEAPGPDLRKQLTKAEAKIRKLEKDQEILLVQCEQHMSAAHAHAEGELRSRTKAKDLEAELQQMTTYLAEATTQINDLEADSKFVRSKYEKLKVKYRELVADWMGPDRSESNSTMKRRKSHSVIDSSEFSLYQHASSSSMDRRIIRPLPRPRGEQITTPVARASAVSPPPVRSKRQRVSEPAMRPVQ